MQFSGTEEIAAPREKVWAFVIDPQQVGECGPGVEKIDVIEWSPDTATFIANALSPAKPAPTTTTSR